MINAGEVRVDGAVVTRASTSVRSSDPITTSNDPYVSRGAYKLLGALDDLRLAVSGRALDAGASTGGFTQVLLERGATAVTAVDVGSGQLDARLRADLRVRSWEQTNLRDLTLAQVGGEPVDLVVADVSFISLTLLVAPLGGVTRDDGRLLLMVKPQFEVGRERLGKGGVVRSVELHRLAVDQVVAAAAAAGWYAQAGVPSRLPGPSGNREFFVLFARGAPRPDFDAAGIVAADAEPVDR
jgi:23S rRNA (cytidine1920-2'-O)/16S rRNA (cytidine1409-2'-O)-methyltransferase